MARRWRGRRNDIERRDGLRDAGLAALSADGIKNLVLPPEASHVAICADNDASGTGERAAHDAAARWLIEGRRVRIALPPEVGTDFNDLLRTGRLNEETRHGVA